MSDIKNQDAEITEPEERGVVETNDTRKPYEPPRLTKKRSVARATLFSAMGAAMAGTTFMG